MQAGKLRHRVTIQYRGTLEPNNLGHQSKKWKDLATVSAEVTDLSGRELERARQIVAEASVSVRIRHFAGLTTKNHRFTFRGRTLVIAAILDRDGKQLEDLVICGEVK